MKPIIYCLLLLISLPLSAQEIIDFKSLGNEQTLVQTKRSEIFSTPVKGKFDQKNPVEDSWDITFNYLGIRHGSDIPKSQQDSIKYLKNQQKKAFKPLPDWVPDPQYHQDQSTPEKLNMIDPVVQLDFKGNNHVGFTPPDNNIAVSDNGDIVSVTNSSLFFADNNGNSVFQSSFSSFFSVLGLTGIYFDPKVLYDPVDDKFILVVLNGTTPSNSTVVVAFSTSSDPNDSWWFYTFNGNILNDGSWFDYPNIGVSETELYISGNLYDADNNFNQVIIFQIEKAAGFTGGAPNWIYWFDVEDAFGLNDFNVIPISYGFDGALGPGIFFLSTEANFAASLMLYWTSGTINSNPTLSVNNILAPFYGPGGDGMQLGTTDLLASNDSRVQSGFYGNGIIHFVMNTDKPDGFTGIYYGRIDVNSLTATRTTYGLQNFDYCFPAIAPFTTSTSDNTVLIGFLRTGATIYPEFRVVTCDEDWNWSPSVLVKGGESYVDYLAGDVERWGDYSGIARRHLDNGIEVWVSGCYGEDLDNGYALVLGTWIGKISDQIAQQAPVADFVADQTQVTEGEQVSFTDLSTNAPTGWTWSFPGGSPGSSTDPNPQITYNTAGTYNVSLVASNAGGEDTESKNAYITVLPQVQAPVADFVADQTQVTEGEQVSFTDLSTNTPTGWTWSFPGGSPGSSTAPNPQITYNTAGTYNVSLVASNAGGEDTESKNAYITVLPQVQVPVADFVADNTTIEAGGIVQFTDLSTNTPTGWTWSFPGGNPAVSNLQNPIVVYSAPGVFPVTLVASNQAGNNALTKEDYITVNIPSSTTQQQAGIGYFDIYPNPVTARDRVSVKFEMKETTELNFYLVDNQGRVVKHLLRHRTKKGENLISFRTELLAAGTYYVVLQNAQNQLVKSGKFVVIL